MPQTFHSQPQNSSPTKTATAFIRAARLVSHRRQQEAFEAGDHQRDAADEQRHLDRAELQEGDDRGAAA